MLLIWGDIGDIHEKNRIDQFTNVSSNTTNDHRSIAAQFDRADWHVVTGSKTDILGEIQLEAFYVAQLEVSRFWLALLAKNLLKSTVYDIDSSTQYMESLTQGWMMGRNAKPLFGIDWSTLWETPLEQIRTFLNVNT